MIGFVSVSRECGSAGYFAIILAPPLFLLLLLYFTPHRRVVNHDNRVLG